MPDERKVWSNEIMVNCDVICGLTKKRCLIRYKVDINNYNSKNWLFSIVVSLQKIVVHFYCKKTQRSYHDQKLLSLEKRQYLLHYENYSGSLNDSCQRFCFCFCFKGVPKPTLPPPFPYFLFKYNILNLKYNNQDFKIQILERKNKSDLNITIFKLA